MSALILNGHSIPGEAKYEPNLTRGVIYADIDIPYEHSAFKEIEQLVFNAGHVTLEGQINIDSRPYHFKVKGEISHGRYRQTLIADFRSIDDARDCIKQT